MKLYRLCQLFAIAIGLFTVSICRVNAQDNAGVDNNNNESVQINEQGEGSQQQGQSAEGGSSEVTVTDEDASDNFWTSGYRGRFVIPPGGASLSCGDRGIAFSRSEGFGFGVGAAGINFSDNTGQIPEEFASGLSSIKQCLKEKNIAEILQQYLKLAEQDRAVANTYLRTVSPEVYATFFVQNAKQEPGIVSEQSYSDLTTNLREQKFDRVVKWLDNYDSAALAEKRVLLQENRELREIEQKQRIRELEVLELERKTREAETILKYRQSQLDGLLEDYQQ